MNKENTRAIASLGAGSHERFLRIARHSVGAYAERHGYDLHTHTQSVDASRPPAWSKILLLRDLLKRYELVVWLDADLVIVDGRKDLARELEPDKFLYLVEHAYNDERIPNAGVMMLRSGETAARFLDEIWALEHYMHHEWWEQAAIMDVLGYDVVRKVPSTLTAYRKQTKLISPRWNSTLFAPARRPRIRHFAGWPNRARLGLMLAADAEATVRRATGY